MPGNSASRDKQILTGLAGLWPVGAGVAHVDRGRQRRGTTLASPTLSTPRWHSHGAGWARASGWRAVSFSPGARRFAEQRQGATTQSGDTAHSTLRLSISPAEPGCQILWPVKPSQIPSAHTQELKPAAGMQPNGQPPAQPSCWLAGWLAGWLGC